MSLKICEIFGIALQGEGPEIGRPTIFLRLSGCNLIREGKSCRFCDSLFAEQGIEKSIKEVKKIIKEFHFKHITMTGGEPVLQELAIGDLMNELGTDYKYSLETNGTIHTNLPFDNIIISPKKQKIDMKVLKEYSKQDNTYFKFVYEDANDWWWEPIIFSLKIPKDRVYIMPEGKTRDEQLSKMEEVAEYCTKNKYNLSLRAHVLIWGNRRGV